MNSYNIYDEDQYSTVLYHAIARDENQVKELANQAGFNLDGLVIELERMNVKDELGRPFSANIQEALVV